jgi:hypothetical protein
MRVFKDILHWWVSGNSLETTNFKRQMQVNETPGSMAGEKPMAKSF